MNIELEVRSQFYKQLSFGVLQIVLERLEQKGIVLFLKII
jgi:hypothetical protein